MCHIVLYLLISSCACVTRALSPAGRLGGTGLLLGPFNHVWYAFLDRVLPGCNTATVLRKILSDQLIASPFFAFAFFAGQFLLFFVFFGSHQQSLVVSRQLPPKSCHLCWSSVAQGRYRETVQSNLVYCRLTFFLCLLLFLLPCTIVR